MDAEAIAGQGVAMLPTLLGTIAKGLMLSVEDSASLTIEFDCIT